MRKIFAIAHENDRDLLLFETNRKFRLVWERMKWKIFRMSLSVVSSSLYSLVPNLVPRSVFKIFRTNDLSSLRVVTRRWPIQTHNRTTVSINDIIFIYSQSISSRVLYFFFHRDLDNNSRSHDIGAKSINKNFDKYR